MYQVTYIYIYTKRPQTSRRSDVGNARRFKRANRRAMTSTADQSGGSASGGSNSATSVRPSSAAARAPSATLGHPRRLECRIKTRDKSVVRSDRLPRNSLVLVVLCIQLVCHVAGADEFCIWNWIVSSTDLLCFVRTRIEDRPVD